MCLVFLTLKSHKLGKVIDDGTVMVHWCQSVLLDVLIATLGAICLVRKQIIPSYKHTNLASKVPSFY